MGERNILDEIVARTRQRVAEAKIGKPLAVVRAEAEEVCRRQSGTA